MTTLNKAARTAVTTRFDREMATLPGVTRHLNTHRDDSFVGVSSGWEVETIHGKLRCCMVVTDQDTTIYAKFDETPDNGPMGCCPSTGKWDRNRAAGDYPGSLIPEFITDLIFITVDGLKNAA